MKGTILEGVRVVEFGAYQSAPIAGMLFAEQGAEVIHIKYPDFVPFDPVLRLSRTKQKSSLLI